MSNTHSNINSNSSISQLDVNSSIGEAPDAPPRVGQSKRSEDARQDIPSQKNHAGQPVNQPTDDPRSRTNSSNSQNQDSRTPVDHRQDGDHGYNTSNREQQQQQQHPGGPGGYPPQQYHQNQHQLQHQPTHHHGNHPQQQYYRNSQQQQQHQMMQQPQYPYQNGGGNQYGNMQGNDNHNNNQQQYHRPSGGSGDSNNMMMQQQQFQIPPQMQGQYKQPYPYGQPHQMSPQHHHNPNYYQGHGMPNQHMDDRGYHHQQMPQGHRPNMNQQHPQQQMNTPGGHHNGPHRGAQGHGQGQHGAQQQMYPGQYQQGGPHYHEQGPPQQYAASPQGNQGHHVQPQGVQLPIHAENPALGYMRFGDGAGGNGAQGQGAPNGQGNPAPVPGTGQGGGGGQVPGTQSPSQPPQAHPHGQGQPAAQPPVTPTPPQQRRSIKITRKGVDVDLNEMRTSKTSDNAEAVVKNGMTIYPLASPSSANAPYAPTTSAKQSGEAAVAAITGAESTSVVPKKTSYFVVQDDDESAEVPVPTVENVTQSATMKVNEPAAASDVSALESQFSQMSTEPPVKGEAALTAVESNVTRVVEMKAAEVLPVTSVPVVETVECGKDAGEAAEIKIDLEEGEEEEDNWESAEFAAVLPISPASEPAVAPLPVPEPVPAAPVASEKSVKTKIGANHVDSDGLLDAYIITPSEPVVAPPAAPMPAPVPKPAVPAAASAGKPTGISGMLAEYTTTRRSLRPGGGVASSSLVQVAAGRPSDQPKTTYSMKDMLHIKQNMPLESFCSVALFDPIVKVESAKRNNNMGGNLGNSGGGSSGGYNRQNQGRNDHYGGKNNYNNNQQFQGQGGYGGKQNQGQGGMGGLGNRKLAGNPIHKKQVTDPAQVLQREVKAILNKITPQTFNKLSQQLCEIPIISSKMMDILSFEIFEKAIDEPKFANLYAEMSAYIQKNMNDISFSSVFFNEDSHQYQWICDLSAPPVLSGPFPNYESCILEAFAQPHFSVNFSQNMQIFKIVVSKNMFIFVCKINGSEEYYMNCNSYSKMEAAFPISELGFASEVDALTDARKKRGFKDSLIMKCQNEFQASTSYSGKYEKSTSGEKDATDEESALKLKLRMLGNIRFTGELYKQKLVKSNIMHHCMVELIGERVEGSQVTVKRKAEYDEQALELLCNFIRTVGQSLEASTTNSKKHVSFDAYFAILQDLATDKKISSRLRFSIREVIELRCNKWQERREVEVPLTLEEIHNKALQEEYNKEMEKQRPGHQRHSNSGQMGSQDGRRSGVATNNTRPQTGPNPTKIIKKGGTPKGTPNSKSGSPNKQQQPQHQKGEASRSTVPVQKELPRSEVLKLVKSVIDEYIKEHDMNEVSVRLECVKNLADTGICIVHYILTKLVMDGAVQDKARLMEFMHGASSFLTAGGSQIASSLVDCEAVTLLQDVISDCREAPEIIGGILSSLIRLNVCTVASIEDSLEACLKVSLADEYTIPEQAIGAHKQVRAAMGL